MSLTFNPDGHRYHVFGKERRSVTQILVLMGIVDAQWFTRESRIRGTMVHSAISMLEGPEGLDIFSLRATERALREMGETIIPYVRAYLKFKKKTGWIPERLEDPQYHKLFHYPCRIDQIGKFPGGRDSILELKTVKSGGKQKWWRFQIGGNKEAWKSHTGKCYDSFSVTLRADGTYKLDQYTDPQDGPEFIALMSAYQILEREGKFKEA